LDPSDAIAGAAHVAIVAMVPVGGHSYRAEFVTARRAVPGEPWPPGSWRVLLDNGWISMPKAPPPRRATEEWGIVLVPHVRGAMRRGDDERQGRG
jgi:hypothetical protein